MEDNNDDNDEDDAMDDLVKAEVVKAMLPAYCKLTRCIVYNVTCNSLVYTGKTGTCSFIHSADISGPGTVGVL